jgi:predicted flap endonuclease-1-like 5' DNA nuclease
MKWFFIQSLVALLAAFALGVPIGYLMWRLQYRKVRTFETAGSIHADVSTSNDAALASGTRALDSAGVGVLDVPSTVVSTPSVAIAGDAPQSVSAGTPGTPALERLRVEHAAEVGRLRSSLAEREASLAEIRAQLNTSRKALLERDSRIATFTANNPAGGGNADEAAAKLQALAEQRDVARAGLAKALADYETRLAAFRTEHTQDIARLRTEHQSALAALNTDSEQRINEIRSERESAAQALQKISAETDQQRAELQSRHESALADLRKRAERAEAELTSVRAELETQRAEVARSAGSLDADRRSRQSEIDTALAAATRAEASLAEAVATRNEMHRNLVDANASLSQVNVELSNVRVELATIKTDLATSRTALDTARAAVLATEADTKSLRSELGGLKANLTESRSASDEHRNSAQTVHAEFFTLKSTYETLRSEHAALQLRHQALVVEERALRNQASTPAVTQSVVAAAVVAPTMAPVVSTPTPAGSAPATSVPSSTRRMPVNLSTVDPDGQDTAGDVDDLEHIEGIGPRISASLQAVGIRTFARLAVSREERLRDALARAGLNLAPSLPTWSQQARFLAMDDEASFRQFVEQLIAGREVK